MKVYGVTENELRTITAINLGITVLFSIGTGLLAVSFDLYKDILITGSLPEDAIYLRDAIQPAAMWLGIALYGVGVVAWFIRGGFIQTIKSESSS